MSFKTADLAFKHIPIHEQRMRLKAPTALADSHLSAYWPSGMPWLVDHKFTAKALPPGSYVCSADGCNKVGYTLHYIYISLSLILILPLIISNPPLTPHLTLHLTYL